MSSKRSSFRRIEIDEQVPFAGLENYTFPTTGGFSNEQNDWAALCLGEPAALDGFLFHLTKGEHRITFTNAGGRGQNLDYLCLAGK